MNKPTDCLQAEVVNDIYYTVNVWDSFAGAVEWMDPFQTGGPHRHSMPLEFVAGDIDFAIRAGEIDEDAEERICQGHPSLHGWSEYCDGSCENVRARWGHD